MSENQLFQSKSLLAKLLAQENIEVIHRKVPTAYFDLNTRVIVLPFWKDMDDPVLYDLLMGHEVGHAQYTPKQGWHDALVNNKSFKTYLNVIEDARIERKMKDKYPGLRRSFNLAYKKLHERDFFALEGKDVSKALFIDRINIFYKLGAFVNVPFTPDELKIIDRINVADTWDDVEKIARDIFDKAIQDKLSNPDPESDQDDEDDMEESPYDSDDESEMDDWSEDYDEDYGDDEDYVERKGNSSSDEDEEESDDSSVDPNTNDDSTRKKEEGEEVASQTDQAFRSNEKSLVDDSSGNVHVLNVPVYNNCNIFSWKVVHKMINQHREDLKDPKHKAYGYYNYGNGAQKFVQESVNLYAELIKRTTPTVNYMVKEFEMRKNATQMARAKVGKSGKINPKKLSRYNMDNDIFQRITTVPQGKNHGLVMFVDLSGSMTSIIKKTFEQAVMLTMFCKKVNIPFEVYGFSNHPAVITLFNDNIKYSRSQYYDVPKHYNKKPNDLFVSDDGFHLKQYLSSTMPSSAYRQAVENMLWVGAAHASYNLDLIPPTEHLYGTPLDEAVVASINVVNSFKAVNRLDITNTIFLTDGLGAISGQYANSEGRNGWLSPKDTIYVQHPSNKERVKFKNLTKTNNSGEWDPFVSTRALIEIAKAATGSKYTGYYIGDRVTIAKHMFQYLYPRINRDVDSANLSLIKKNISKNGFYSAHVFGFDEYFFVLEENLKVDEKSEIEVEDNAKKGVLAKAFMKSLNKRGLQRMFLNDFVQNLAA